MRNYHYIFWTKYYEYKFRSKNRVNDVIYMFHSIHEGETDPKTFVTNKESFSAFLERELNARTACSIDEIFTKSSTARFAVTFDDVFENIYTNAYLVLKKYHIPFTLFVSSGLIGKEGYLTKEQLVDISKDPLCTVGSHTVTHSRLRTAHNSYEEMVSSKETIEQILQTPVKYFAYPYGSVYACSRKNIREAKKAGYVAAFSTIKATVPSDIDTCRYFLPRVNGDHLVKEMEEGKE